MAVQGGRKREMERKDEGESGREEAGRWKEAREGERRGERNEERKRGREKGRARGGGGERRKRARGRV